MCKSAMKIWQFLPWYGMRYIRKAISEQHRKIISSIEALTLDFTVICALLSAASEGLFQFGIKTRIRFCSAGQISSNAQDFIIVIQTCSFPSNVTWRVKSIVRLLLMKVWILRHFESYPFTPQHQYAISPYCALIIS